MQNIRHKYQDTRHETRVSGHETRGISLMSKSLISNPPSLCNIPVTPNKKGQSLLQPLPQTSPKLSSKFAKSTDNTGGSILVILFLITKTLQMYVFI